MAGLLDRARAGLQKFTETRERDRKFYDAALAQEREKVGARVQAERENALRHKAQFDALPRTERVAARLDTIKTVIGNLQERSQRANKRINAKGNDKGPLYKETTNTPHIISHDLNKESTLGGMLGQDIKKQRTN